MALARNLPKPAKPPPPLTEHRCPYCNQLFFLAELKAGSKLQIKCDRCHHTVMIYPAR